MSALIARCFRADCSRVVSRGLPRGPVASARRRCGVTARRRRSSPRRRSRAPQAARWRMGAGRPSARPGCGCAKPTRPEELRGSRSERRNGRGHCGRPRRFAVARRAGSSPCRPPGLRRRVGPPPGRRAAGVRSGDRRIALEQRVAEDLLEAVGEGAEVRLDRKAVDRPSPSGSSTTAAVPPSSSAPAANPDTNQSPEVCGRESHRRVLGRGRAHHVVVLVERVRLVADAAPQRAVLGHRGRGTGCPERRRSAGSASRWSGPATPLARCHRARRPVPGCDPVAQLLRGRRRRDRRRHGRRGRWGSAGAS